jgi:cell division septation protein DedD
VENFSLAQAPSNTASAGADTANSAGKPVPADAGAPAAKAPAAAPAPAPAKSAKASEQAGSYGIQLGAFKSSADAANRRWAHLDKEYPKLLAGLAPTVAPKNTASGTLYRLRVAALTEKRAREICKYLKEKSQPCVPIHPGAH